MAAWVSKLVGVFGKQPAPLSEEPWEVTCGCGQVYKGMRTASPQQLECQNCDERILIYPLSVYPPLPGGRRTLASVPKSTAPSSTAVPSGGVTNLVSLESPVPSTARMERLVSPQPPRSALLTPLRVVSLLMLVIVGTTIVWKMKDHRRLQAEADFAQQADAGFAALEAGDFFEAETAFQAAAHAADLLQLEHGRSQQVRQYARELKAINQLANYSPGEIFERGEAMLQTESAEECERELLRLMEDRWTIFSGEILKRPDDSGEMRVVYDLPIIHHGSPSVYRDDSPLLSEWLANQDRKAVVLATRWKSCRKIDGAWVIQMDPEATFLWSHLDTLRPSGLMIEGDDPAVIDLLQQQSQMLGLE